MAAGAWRLRTHRPSAVRNCCIPWQNVVLPAPAGPTTSCANAVGIGAAPPPRGSHTELLLAVADSLLCCVRGPWPAAERRQPLAGAAVQAPAGCRGRAHGHLPLLGARPPPVAGHARTPRALAWRRRSPQQALEEPLATYRRRPIGCLLLAKQRNHIAADSATFYMFKRNVGLVVEYDPATVETRVRFPDVAFFLLAAGRSRPGPIPGRCRFTLLRFATASPRADSRTLHFSWCCECSAVVHSHSNRHTPHRGTQCLH